MSRAAAIPRFPSPPGSPGPRGVRGANTLWPTGTELSYGSSGDAYAGYDRFGRIAETLWKTGTTVQVHTKYGHNRAGGVTWRRNLKAASLPGPATQDQHTWYDGLRQVERHDRGGLTPATGPPYAGISNLRQQEDFTYDETGNWLRYQSYAPALVQDRAHNKANQITEITGPLGVVQPAYDPVGNMSALPAPGDWTKAFTCQWDAWNRLVQIKDGGTVLQANSYDGLTRRIRKTTAAEPRDYYFDQQWRAIEERVSGAVKADHVYDPGDRWNLIRRRRSVGGVLDEVRFVLRDFLDPAAIVTPAGTVDERYGYSAFGVARIMDANFVARAASACDWTWLFHGEFLDAESGLYNYGYRHYHPDLGRWISRDPIGEEGGLNLYGFVGNDGVGIIDYLGRQTLTTPSGIPYSVGGGGSPYKTPAGVARLPMDSSKINSDNFEVQNLKYNTNRIEAGFCGCDPFQVGKATAKALGNFRYFDHEGIELRVSGNMAAFKPLGWVGIINRIGIVTGVAGTHNVTLYGPGQYHDQVAITNEGHGLIGIRTWGHKIKAGENNCQNPHELELITEAFETWNNLGGGLGAEKEINATAKKMWTDYLLDTAEGVLKASGCRVCSKRESLTLYPSTSFRQKNPFLHLIPQK